MSFRIPTTLQLVQSGDLTVDQPIVAEPWRTIIEAQAYYWSTKTCQIGGRVYDGAVVDSNSLTQQSISGKDLVGLRPIAWPRRESASDRSEYALTTAVYATGTSGVLEYTLDIMNDTTFSSGKGIAQTIASGTATLTMGDWTLISVVAAVSDYGTTPDRPPGLLSYRWEGDMTVYQVGAYGTPITDTSKLPVS